MKHHGVGHQASPKWYWISYCTGRYEASYCYSSCFSKVTNDMEIFTPCEDMKHHIVTLASEFSIHLQLKPGPFVYVSWWSLTVAGGKYEYWHYSQMCLFNSVALAKHVLWNIVSLIFLSFNSLGYYKYKDITKLWFEPE